MGMLLQDLKYALRVLRKNPSFAVAAIVVLGLGIGANTAIFSVVNAVLLRPLPFHDPGRLVQVWHVPPPESFPGMPIFAVSPANYLDWRSQNHVFEKMAIYTFDRLSMASQDRPEAVTVAVVSADFFTVLRVPPVVGRVFTPEEEQEGREHFVVLSQNFWQTHFGASPGILNQSIRLSGVNYTVVGVMPEKFRFPAPSDPQWQPQMWTMLAWTDKDRATRGNHNYMVIARLNPDINAKQAQSEMATISLRLAQQYPDVDTGWGAKVVPLHEELVGDVRPALFVLLGAVAFVLLIACANVANLVLAKTLGRRKEIAIRTAMGASRWRILGHVLTETLLLSLVGGALGLFLARFGISLIVSFLAAQLPRAMEIGIDGWVLAFTFGISIVTGIVAGLAPTLRLTKADFEVNQSLKQGLGRTDSASSGSRTRNVLVIAEVALSLVLLIGAGLMIRSLSLLQHVDPGFDPHNVLSMSIVLPTTKYATPARQLGFFNEAFEKIRALPGVEEASAVDSLPLGGNGSTQPISIEGQPVVAVSKQPAVAVRNTVTDYFRVMHIPLIGGREFSESDTEGTQAVVVISESMAKKFWPNQNPIGKHVTLAFHPEKPREVIGIVGDVKQDGLDVVHPIPTLYTPFKQLPFNWLSLVVRAKADPYSIASSVTHVIHQVDPEQPIVSVQTMEEILALSVSQHRFNMLLLTAFAGLALLLAAVGLYSVLSFALRQRMREIGIRIALGAKSGDVLRMIVSEGMKTTLIGLVIGLAGALALGRVVSNLIYGVTATDPITFALVSTLLAAVALLACLIPAYRATTIDPIRTLREE